MLKSEGSVVEKLDALMWININAVDRFSDEYNIQLAWIRESPPNTANLGSSFSARLSDLKSLLAQGVRSGELHVEGPSADIRAWSLFELLWMPENIVQQAGPARRAGARPRDDAARARHAARDRSAGGQATDFTSRYWSKPAVPFWRPTPLAL